VAGNHYISAFLIIEFVFAVDEVVIGCAFDAGIVGAFKHQQLSAGVLAAVAPVH
jgi:hypothetical protein